MLVRRYNKLTKIENPKSKATLSTVGTTRLKIFDKNRVVKSLLFLVTLSSCIAIAEIGLRKYNPLRFPKDERSLMYRYDATLGWFPIPNNKTIYAGTRTFTIENNQRGFRDSEHTLDDRPRILFLGDSFVWGYDVEETERFTDRLRAMLPHWSIYNLGVSGYGTDQEFLLLKQQFNFYVPKIVFLVFCVDNDRDDNSRNIRYGEYYKPYFITNGDQLQLRGIPVPQSENYFFAKHELWARSYVFRLLVKSYFKLSNPPEVKVEDPTQAIIANMHEFVSSKGAQLAIGLTSRQAELETFLKKRKIPYVDLTNSYKYPPPGKHWTPRGHVLVSRRIYDFLTLGGYLKIATVVSGP